jgi:hypothetical protein
MPCIVRGAHARRRGNRLATIRDLRLLARQAAGRMRSPAGTLPRARRTQVPASKEDAVKELSIEEVLRIAGGLPVPAALDELTYRLPEAPGGDPVDCAQHLAASLSPSDPT